MAHDPHDVSLFGHTNLREPHRVFGIRQADRLSHMYVIGKTGVGVVVGGATGAGYGEKSVERLARRNGYRDRDWETQAGTVELRIPNGLPPLKCPSTRIGFIPFRRTRRWHGSERSRKTSS